MNTNPDGTVGIDLADLTLELDRAVRIENEQIRATTMRRIQIEACLDIAVSLRTLAAESALAMGQSEGQLGRLDHEPDDDEPDDDEPDPGERDFLVVGDLVHILDDERVHEVLKVGVSEGESWAEVDDGGVVRYWQRNLVRLRGDERPDPDPLAEVIIEPVSPEIVARIDALEAVEPEVVANGMIDDIDDEFEGDDFTETESALEKLRALEKKPAKKAAPKKGKKS